MPWPGGESTKRSSARNGAQSCAAAPMAEARSLRGRIAQPRCERRGAGYEAPRRRRCRAIVEERERSRRLHAAATRRAQGGYGVSPALLFVSDVPASPPPRALDPPRKTLACGYVFLPRRLLEQGAREGEFRGGGHRGGRPCVGVTPGRRATAPGGGAFDPAGGLSTSTEQESGFRRAKVELPICGLATGRLMRCRAGDGTDRLAPASLSEAGRRGW